MTSRGLGLAVPERYGGAGRGLTELGDLFHTAGRTLGGAPLLSTTLASALVFASGDEAMCHRLLPGFADGSVRGAAAVAEDDTRWSDPPAATAVGAHDDWRITGTKTWVFDGVGASVLVVSAAVEGVPTLFLVEDVAGLETVALGTVDPTRRVARVHLDATAAELLGPARRPLAAVADAARALLAAEQTGIARHCFDAARATSAATDRLGMLAQRVETAQATTAAALRSADDEPERLAVSARVALLTASDAALLAAHEWLRTAGAAGLAPDHAARRYLERARVNRMVFGDEQADIEFLAADAVATVAE